MAYFAAVLSRFDAAWSGQEVDVSDLADTDAVVDLLRESGKPDGPTLLVVEREDEWFSLVRLHDDELKVFCSDVYGVAHSGLGDVLLPTGEADALQDEDRRGDEGDGASVLIAVPGGDSDLLADLGVAEEELLEMCGEEGMLPGDVLSAIAERVGAAEAYDGLR